jgi:hypothetical protein
MRHALTTEHEDLDDSSIRIEYDTMGAQEAILRQHWFALKSSPPSHISAAWIVAMWIPVHVDAGRGIG